MKTKLIGLGILAAVIIAAVAYVFISNHQTITEINGYVGGEKIGLLEDEEVQKILKDRYKLSIDYARAGSIDMITADATGRDFLFPSNHTALELYRQINGDPVKSEIILNTPIVLYTRSAVALWEYRCGHHRPHKIQFRQYVRRPFGQHPLRRRSG